MSEGLKFADELFHRAPDLSHRAAAANQMYNIRGSVAG